MSLSVSPVNSTYFTPSIAANSANATAAYDQALALQDVENTLFNPSDSIFGTDTSAFNTTSSNDNDDSTSLNSAVLLNLSPAALNVLNGIDTTADGIDTITGTPLTANTLTVNGIINQATLASTGSTSADTAVQAPLTPAQTAQVSLIISNYANQPATPQTFAQIENALAAAGINPQQISIQQLFNAYAYAYTPGLAFVDKVFTDTNSDFTDA